MQESEAQGEVLRVENARLHVQLSQAQNIITTNAVASAHTEEDSRLKMQELVERNRSLESALGAPSASSQVEALPNAISSATGQPLALSPDGKAHADRPNLAPRENSPRGSAVSALSQTIIAEQKQAIAERDRLIATQRASMLQNKAIIHRLQNAATGSSTVSVSTPVPSNQPGALLAMPAPQELMPKRDVVTDVATL